MPNPTTSSTKSDEKTGYIKVTQSKQSNLSILDGYSVEITIRWHDGTRRHLSTPVGLKILPYVIKRLSNRAVQEVKQYGLGGKDE